MNLHLSYKKASLTGPQTPGALTAVLVETPSWPLKKKRGELFLVFDFAAQPHFKVSEIGQALLGQFSKNYFQDENPPLLSLTQQIENLAEKIKQTALEHQIELEFNLQAAVLWGDLLSAASLGEGSLLLKRGQKVTPLLGSQDFLKDEDLPQISHPHLSLSTASGHLHDQDLLIFANPGFIQAIKMRDLLSKLDHKDPEVLVKDLKPLLYEEAKAQAAALLLLLFHLETLPDLKEEGLRFIDVDKRPLVPLGRFLAFLKRKIARLNLWRFPKRPKISLRPLPRRLPRRFLLLGLIIPLFFLLSLSLFLSFKTQKKSLNQLKAQELLTLAEQKLDQSRRLQTLNPVRARELLYEAQEDIATAKKSLTEDQKFLQKAEELSKKVQAALPEIAGLHQTKLEAWLDLNLIKKDQTAVDLSFTSPNSAALVLTDDTVLIIDLQTKNHTLIGKLKETRKLAAAGDKTYLLNPQGVFALAHQTTQTPQEPLKILENETDWENVSDFAFYGGSLYFLSSKDNQIYKYIATDLGFSSRRDWLSPGVSLDFSQAKSLAIDGSIYVLADSKILKFLRGSPENFALENLPQPLENPVDIFTSENHENFYLLEPQRLVVTDKRGLYRAQYSWENISPSHLVVNQEETKVFLLEKGMIYSLEL